MADIVDAIMRQVVSQMPIDTTHIATGFDTSFGIDSATDRRGNKYICGKPVYQVEGLEPLEVAYIGGYLDTMYLIKRITLDIG